MGFGGVGAIPLVGECVGAGVGVGGGGGVVPAVYNKLKLASRTLGP